MKPIACGSKQEIEKLEEREWQKRKQESCGCTPKAKLYYDDEGVTTSVEAPSRRITRSMSRGESSIPSPLSLFCITLV